MRESGILKPPGYGDSTCQSGPTLAGNLSGANWTRRVENGKINAAPAKRILGLTRLYGRLGKQKINDCGENRMENGEQK